MGNLDDMDGKAWIGAFGAGVAAAGIGGYHLLAWLAGSMTDRGFSHITMKTNAALCLLLAAVTLVTNSTAATAIDNLGPAISESGGDVTTGTLPTVQGDQTQLVQLFQNLIGNGLKYRKPGIPPHVRVSARRVGGEWIFSVSDNGIGIAPQHFDRVFQIFQRLHTKDEYPGTGIGLASCKKIVERHNGRIWVESTPGEGSTFYFSIPSNGEVSR